MSKRLANFFQKAKESPKYKSKMRQAEVSADLRLLIAESGKKYKDVATVIGITPAALSKKLGGETNLTLDSISAIAEAVGADYDILFRPKDAKRALQMWDRAAEADGILEKAGSLLEEILAMHTKVQAQEKTSADLLRLQYRQRQSIATGFRLESVSINDENYDMRIAAGGAQP